MASTLSDSRTGPQPDDPDGEPIDLANVIAPLWAGRTWIVVAAVIGTLLGLLLALRVPAVYEATATLMLRQSESPAATPASYRTLLLGNQTAAALLKDFALDQPPYHYSVQTVVDDVLTVEEIRNTSLLRVRVRLAQAELAARVANAVAARGVALSQTISYPPGALETARLQVENTRERLRAAEERLLTYQRTAQIEAVRTDVDATLQQRRSLPELLISIEAERARLSAAEAELKTLQPRVTVRRDVDSEMPMWRALQLESTVESARAAASAAAAPGTALASAALPGQSELERDTVRSAQQERLGEPPESASRPDAAPSPAATPHPPRAPATDPTVGPAEQVNIRNPLANPVYEIMSYQVSASRTKLAVLQKQLQMLVARTHINAAQLGELNTMYSRQIQLARLQIDYDLARKLYLEVSFRYEQMRGESEAKSSRMVIADNAVPPARPMPRGRTRYVLTGLLLGIAVGMPVAFARHLTTRTWRPAA